MSVLDGAVVAVTGGTGSFGRAFCRAALAQGAAKVIAIARNSEMRYRLAQELPDPRLRVVPGDVRCARDIYAALEDDRVTHLVHAAAEKHIGTGEQFRAYTRDVNLRGTMNVLGVAQDLRVRHLVALSTDKACEPVNYYGETKRAAEVEVVTAANNSRRAWSVVRYGNVVGSSGSVIPLFVSQRPDGRLTITDPRMTRFFMPLAPDASWRVFDGDGPVMSAVDLVLTAFRHQQGGEVFIPKIPSGTIVDLAEQMAPECRIEVTGIRPGEKLHEMLISPEEAPRTSWWPEAGVFVIRAVEQHAPPEGSQPVPSCFRYTSDANPQPLRVEGLCALA